VPLNLANNASTTLAATAASTDTTIQLVTGGGNSFQYVSGNYFWGTLEDTAGNKEIVKVTNLTGDTVTVLRGQEGTTAATFPAGSVFEQRPTVQTFKDFILDNAGTTGNILGTANFPGTGSRITGDLSNTTITNRLLLQTNGTNLNSYIGIIPSGTATASGFSAYTDSDLSDYSEARLSVSTTGGVVEVGSYAVGTGTTYPITLSPGGTERVRVTTSGALGFSGANYGVAGQVLTSAGGAAPPSWQNSSSFVGGALTSPLILAGDATAALNPVSKQQFDAAFNRVTRMASVYSFIGGFFSVSLADGSIRSWGYNGFSQLCIGGTSSSGNPVHAIFSATTTLPPISATVVDIVIARHSIFVLYSNGWVYSGGYNNFGQLGHGDTTTRARLTRIEYFVINSITVTKVIASGTWSSGGYNAAIFLGSNGKVYVTGRAYTGDGTAIGNKTLPTTNSLSSVSGIALSSDAAGPSFWAWNSTGQLFSWGDNRQGHLGINSVANPVTTATACVGIVGSVSKVIPVTGYDTSLDAGVYYGSTLVLTSVGAMFGAGNNGEGQLGNGTTTNSNVFIPCTGLSGVTISDFDCTRAGPYTAIAALSSTGTLYTWGHNGHGAVGNGSTVNRATPTAITGTWVKAYGGRDYSNLGGFIAINSSGDVYAWGYEIGARWGINNAAADVLSPTLVGRPILRVGETVIDVYTGNSNGNSFLLTSLGRLFGCGYNVNGEVGIGNINNPSTYFTFQEVKL
jgi:alpha-tubulin suppressor-like RCC1 family protein